MKTILSFLAFTFFTTAIHAQSTQINEIKKTFDQTKDLGRLLSFSHILGKTFICEEFVFNEHKNSYMAYSTTISFKNKMQNYYGSQPTLDYVEYAEYLRVDQDNSSHVPRFGCDGIEWGVAHMDDAPYLQMANLVGRVGNSNSGPCYELKFRLNAKDKMVAIGLYEKQVIHALKCERSNK